MPDVIDGETERSVRTRRKLLRGWLAAAGACLSALVLLSCSTNETAVREPVSNARQTADRSASVSTPTPEQSSNTANDNKSGDSGEAAGEFLITARGIGRARLGMSFGELKKLFPGAKFRLATVRPDETADVAVSVGGKDVLFVRTRNMDETTADELPATDDPIRSLMTNDARYATAAGIRAGSTLEEASKAYGTPELFYQPPTEFAAFKPQEINNLSFHVAAGDGKEPAGVYSMTKDGTEDGWHKSDRARAGAKITFIAVIDMSLK
ncbi:MAG TPA: hypothetical protein VNA19_17410 [Pyrinomonadaceae bacterium]|jgi:hypothetical protein|nr:hypothetical protein [Pyrinomonadaceae bacterium]